MTTIPSTLYSRSFSHRRPYWQTALVVLALFAAPLVAAALDGELNQLTSHPMLRPMFFPSVIISYILLVAPVLSRGELEMVRRLRPVVLVNDEEYRATMAAAMPNQPAYEVAAAAIGALTGIFFTRDWNVGDGTWLGTYLTIALPLMFAVLAWTIYDSMVSTRVLAALHRQPLDINLLDISPFEPVGRLSLLTTLVFLGGAVLGIFLGLEVADIPSAMWNIVVPAYFPLAIFVVLLFFQSMQPTHRALTKAKEEELRMIRQRVKQESERFRAEMAGGDVSPQTAARLEALLAYEQRIDDAPTWPYNPTMLQTLLFSIATPLVVRGVTWLLFER